MRNSGRLIGFAAASALTLAPLAVAAPAWADDEVSGETGAAVATPVGSGNADGGAGLGVQNPFFQPLDAASNAGGNAGVNTPLGDSSFNTGAATDINVPNPADFIPTFGGGAGAGGSAAVNTPVGGGGFTAGAANDFALPAPADVIPTVGGGADGGAAVSTPVGGSGFNTDSSSQIGPDGASTSTSTSTNSGAGVATPVGGANFNTGSAFNFGR